MEDRMNQRDKKMLRLAELAGLHNSLWTEITFNQQGIVIGFQKDQKNGLFEWDRTDANIKEELKKN